MSALELVLDGIAIIAWWWPILNQMILDFSFFISLDKLQLIALSVIVSRIRRRISCCLFISGINNIVFFVNKLYLVIHFQILIDKLIISFDLSLLSQGYLWKTTLPWSSNFEFSAAWISFIRSSITRELPLAFISTLQMTFEHLFLHVKLNFQIILFL